MFSSIKKKHCKRDGCPKYPKIGYKGYCGFECMPPEMREAETKKSVTKRKNALEAQISKKLHRIANDKGQELKSNGKDVVNPHVQLWEWFNDRRKEMTGCCIECGKSTQKNNDKYFFWSICHIVPKGLVPSVATNEFNWIELCYLHHQELDSTFEKASKMMCFSEIHLKFQLFKHLIPPQEMRKVNPHLLK